ncbi:MAG: hypothetical protein IJR49_00525, partial [Treponema sp.]|nr:hypothetical protein [Treponema sp.]
DCEKNIRQAELAKNEAELRYTQARASLNTNDFDNARKKVQESREKYNESLSYQYSDELRRVSDERLLSLANEITMRQNEMVVLQVRELKNQARGEYYNGNFEKSENILSEARTTWALTNVEEDEELLTLYGLVNTALSMKAGRIVSHTNPLYKEMSQVMSIAQQYFKNGLDLLSKNETEKGKEQLLIATEKLQELMIVYPLNKEANLLTLRIQQQIDPDNFKNIFAERVESARKNYIIPEKRQQAYSDLQDLYEINPNYPGLSTLIYDVEIELGIRRKAPDRTANNRSIALTQEARNIFSRAGRDEVRLRLALAKVDEALQYNPNNGDAMLLKDRINIAIGGRASIVLSSDDEAKYQSAIAEMQRNNIVQANAIVEQLLQKSENKRSPKILDLQKRIKALL